MKDEEIHQIRRAMKSEIKSRFIYLKSDCGHYEIIAKLVAEQDGYSNDCWQTTKIYTGSHWSVTMKQDGKAVNYIASVDRNLYMHYGEYANGLCPHGMNLNKNTILYGAFITERFSEALSGIDRDKVTKQWCREYGKARMNEQ